MSIDNLLTHHYSLKIKVNILYIIFSYLSNKFKNKLKHKEKNYIFTIISKKLQSSTIKQYAI